MTLSQARKYIPLETNPRFGVGAAIVDTARAVTAHTRLMSLIFFFFPLVLYRQMTAVVAASPPSTNTNTQELKSLEECTTTFYISSHSILKLILMRVQSLFRRGWPPRVG